MGRTHHVMFISLLAVLSVLAIPAAMAGEPTEPPPSTTTSMVATTTSTTPTTPPSDSEGSDPSPDPTRRPPNPVKRYDTLRKLVFPIVGPTYFHSSFGGCRDNCTREHHGNDLMTWKWKGLPVVAATDGVVTHVTYDEGNGGCSVWIQDRHRWSTRYLHLNNDIPGTDDTGFGCVPVNVYVGAEVKAGQVIGYVGDSGNAEHTPPHVHFELRMPNGHPVDPYRSLKKAERINYEILPTNFQTATLAITASVRPSDTETTIVVTTDEADQLMASEDRPMWVDAPIVAIDPSDPGPAIDELKRLDSRAITILSDTDTRWLRALLLDFSMIVERQPMPTFEAIPIDFVPDSTVAPTVVSNPSDSFATIIAGNTEKIWKSRQDAFQSFIGDHRSLVIDSPTWAARNIGHRSWGSPGRYADRGKLWWGTGDGWVGTDSLEDVPPFGYAYLTERRTTEATLTFLGSLAELPRMPIWR
ncbi:MAG: M23 family metallopeptidase [Acidimicrobiia bacterium]|nr:M23 family metallopeptidase [Acidimicrobiia bacterium]